MMNNKMQQKIMVNNSFQMFDVCSKCEKVELHGVMNDINETDFDLICDKCKKEREQDET